MNSVAQLCCEQSICPECTIPYQSQQMSQFKCVHHIFLQAARCMLLTTPSAKLDLWGYAFMRACFLDQFLGTNGTKSCPYACWHGKPLSPELLNSLRMWGSIVYFAHHDDQHKLQMPGHCGMFLGYSLIGDACFMCDLKHERLPVCITHDVLAHSFNETQHLV